MGDAAAPRRLRILYASGLSPNDSSQYRLWALERLGHTILPVNAYDFEARHPLLRKVTHRLQAGPWVERLNRKLLQRARQEQPDVFWADKLLQLKPATLQVMRSLGIPSVSYMIDNAFGPRRDPGWRLYMRCIPYFDLHVTQRDRNVLDYQARGARDVLKVQTAFEPTVHFAPPAGWSDRDRNREVSFVGTPYDRRAEELTRMWRDFHVPVVISGPEEPWARRLTPEAHKALFREGAPYSRAYREAIWRSKINLSFLTHSNQDEFVHKSFEIAGCGQFLLAERSPGHADRFVEDEEAVFFTGVEECVAKIRRWLPDESGRSRVAAAGHARALRDGYFNDAQVEKIIERLRPLVAAETRL